MTEHDRTRIPTELDPDGEYAPAGEDQGLDATFDPATIATAFGIGIARVHHALAGEFGLGADATVDSRQAQHLADVLLGDRPQDVREAALMELGAFTPRTDHDTGLGERPDGIESDRLVRRGDQGDEERG